MLKTPKLMLATLLTSLLLIVSCASAHAKPTDASDVSDAADQPYRRLIEAEAMKLEGDSYKVQRNRYCSADSAVAVTTTTANAGHQMVQHLEKSLPAGQYLVWVMLYIDNAGSRKGDPLEMKATLGPNASTASVIRDGSASLNLRIIVDATKPFDTLALSMVTPVSGVLVDRVYLSSQATDFSTASPQKDRFTIGVNRIRREMTQGSSPIATGNVIANGSFEAGLPSYEWSTPYQSSHTLTPEMLSSETPAHGKQFLRVPLYPNLARRLGERSDQPTLLTLIHRIVELKPNTTYHFSGQFRSNTPINVQVWIDPAYPARVKPMRSVPRGSGKTTKAWQPITATFTTPNNTNGYTLRLIAQAPDPATLDLDALMLTESATDTFIPAQPIEIGVTWQAPGRVFYADQPVHFDLAVWHGDTAARNQADVHVRVIDYYNQLVYDKTLQQKTSSTLAFNLPTGAYRLLLDGQAQTDADKFKLPLQEYTFAVVNRPPAKMHGTLGSYITLAPQPIEIMSRAGVRSTTTLSASNDLLQNWRFMEPEQGKFVWIDKAVAFARDHDVKIIGNLDFSRSEPTIPDWAFNPDPSDALTGGYPGGNRKFSRKAWEQFIEALTRHYAGSVDDWLILDEPFHTITPEDYVALLKATYTAAKRGNPNCRIIAHGGYYPTWLPAVETAGGVPYFDGISDYARNPEQAGRLRTFATKHNKFVFTVEYEWNATLYHTLQTAQTDWDRTAPWYQQPTQVSLIRALSSMSWAHAIKFQRYDARYPGGDMTQLDLYKSLFELDGSLKPAGVAYAIAAGILDGFHGSGELSLNPAFRSLLFEKADERFTIVLSTPAEQVAQAKFELPKDVTLQNLMGQRVDPQDVMLSNAALYVVGPHSQLQAAQEMLRGLKLTSAVKVDAQTVVDETSGQHVLMLTLTNQRSHPITATIAMQPDVVRDFWNAVRTTPVIKPGQTIQMRIGLNVYTGDVLPTRDSRMELYVDGHAAAMQISNIYEPGVAKLSQ